MELNAAFYESNMELAADILESEETIDPGFGEVQTLQGKDGATFTPNVADDGTMSWTNNRNLPNPDPVNIIGPTGPQGPAFTYEDFTAEQLNALRGPQGPAGDIGPTGPQGPIGETGPQGPAYTLTDADKVSIRNAVIEALPVYNGEVVAV